MSEGQVSLGQSEGSHPCACPKFSRWGCSWFAILLKWTELNWTGSWNFFGEMAELNRDRGSGPLTWLTPTSEHYKYLNIIVSFVGTKFNKWVKMTLGTLVYFMWVWEACTQRPNHFKFVMILSTSSSAQTQRLCSSMVRSSHSSISSETGPSSRHASDSNPLPWSLK